MTLVQLTLQNVVFAVNGIPDNDPRLSTMVECEVGSDDRLILTNEVRFAVALWILRAASLVYGALTSLPHLLAAIDRNISTGQVCSMHKCQMSNAETDAVIYVLLSSFADWAHTSFRWAFELWFRRLPRRRRRLSQS